MSDLHVVLGASGSAGGAISAALRGRGLRVRTVSRRPASAGTEHVTADITTSDGAADAVAGASVVYMAAQPPYHRWPQEFPAMLRVVAEATADAGAKLVMVDNLYGYGPGHGSLGEDTAETAADRKGVVRSEMAASLRDAHERGRLRVTIGRASDYFGPNADNSAITALTIEPAVAGKRMRWLGALDQPHSAAFLPDIADAYATLGTSDKADGETWILPHAPAATGSAFMELVNEALPEPVPTGLVRSTMLRVAAPFHRISRESLGILYQWDSPFIADDDKFQRVFGPAAATPLDEAIAATVTWYSARHDSP